LVSVAAYQPDIPQNLGALIRLCACLDSPLHVVDPCGFPFAPRKFRRSAMDYVDLADIRRHASWEDFVAETDAGGIRRVLLTSKGALPYAEFRFAATDALVLGRESAGVPESVAASCHARVRIPMRQEARSLNVANACAMVLGEALRQVSVSGSAYP
jgi:tRNA (cytidine/uridine-2'-O-)-methyltransferase